MSIRSNMTDRGSTKDDVFSAFAKKATTQLRSEAEIAEVEVLIDISAASFVLGLVFIAVNIKTTTLKNTKQQMQQMSSTQTS